MMQSSSSSFAKGILLVEGEPLIAASLQRKLSRLGYPVAGVVGSGEEAIRKTDELRPDLVLMDVGVPGQIDGLEAGSVIRKRLDLPVVYVGAPSDLYGHLDYVSKPLRAPDLRCAIELALHRSRAEKHLKEQERLLTAILRSIGDAVLLTDSRARVTFLNPVAEALTGCSAAEAAGREVSEVLRSQGGDGAEPKTSEAARTRTVGNATPVSGSAGLRGARGATPPVVHSAAPILDEQGEVQGAVVVLRDVGAQRKRGEDTAAIERANGLEAFGIPAAHEFRSPLGTIVSFAELMEQEVDDPLSNTQKEHLHVIVAEARRLLRLTDGLMELAHVTQTELHRTDVDLSALARATASRLASSNAHRRVGFVAQEALRASVDPDLIGVVLDNLLENAWKFTAPTRAAQVEFGSVTKEGVSFPIFFVKDNGVGFDSKQSDTLFCAFRRLHPVGDFEGTGIGLTTVQRIVHRHGGTVWAESSVGQGSTFYFTLAP